MAARTTSIFESKIDNISFEKIVDSSVGKVDKFFEKKYGHLSGMYVVLVLVWQLGLPVFLSRKKDNIPLENNRRYFRRKRVHYIDLYIHQQNAEIFLKESGHFFDTRKTLVDVTTNADFVEIYSKGTLELELRTYQKDARISFKKVVNFSDGSVNNFFEGNIVLFFDT